MLTRREVLALMGGLPYMRPDQHYESPTGAIVPGARSVITVKKITIIAGAGGGLFAYSGTPALGNLIASVAAVAGTDAKGNAYLPGMTTYAPNNLGINYAVSLLNNSLVFYTAPAASNGAGPWTLKASAALDTTGTKLVFGLPSGGMSASGGLAVFGSGLQAIGGLTADTEVLSAALASGVMLDITDTVTTTGTLIRVTTAAIGNTFFSSRVTGDTFVRFIIDTDGSGNPRIRFGSGAATQDVNILRSAANTLAVNGADLDINTIGRGLQVAEGANARMGLATLVAGTVTVANTTITGSTRIFMSEQSAGGTQGILRIASRTVGTGFTITSTNAADTSTVAWLLVEPG